MGCAELLDGLARTDLWLVDGTSKVVRLCSSSSIPSTLTLDQVYMRTDFSDYEVFRGLNLTKAALL